jgi:hypothetical protein
MLTRGLRALLLLLAAALVPAPPVVTGQTIPHEPGLVFTGSVLKEEARQARVEPGAPAAGLQRKNLAVGLGGRFRAFTVEDPVRPGGFVDRIFVEDVRAGITYELRDLSNAHRPFNDLKFHRAVLQFDRWAGPHTGIRYRLDVRRRHLVSARAFIEADYLRLMKCSQTPGCQPNKQ